RGRDGRRCDALRARGRRRGCVARRPADPRRLDAGSRVRPRSMGAGRGRRTDDGSRRLARAGRRCAMKILVVDVGGTHVKILATGLGSALIIDGVLEPMELGHLPYKKGATFEDYVGIRGLERHGKKHWRKDVLDVIARLRAALEPDEVVIGGGNAAKLEALPP